MSTDITETVARYVALVEAGTADELVSLFADDATVEDPVGGDVLVGREAIHRFYAGLETLDRSTELTLLRVAGREAAFVFTITFSVGDTRMTLQPVDTVVFNEAGEISSLRSYFAPTDVTPV
ncbi:nuclear transport factor 2 family protein [Mycolicibacterium monacense]|uniref:nuclear transport factor 2 family protein n=1 Tax=Mycolicibacterium monacense TaxID=85693 RepID=UPI0007EB9D0D|nr:nuclear transport factor 2 family protein [Mycolicibacterium monacense]OBF53527.1 steroid delta-isomerase [Mycolicibacterium monacense]